MGNQKNSNFTIFYLSSEGKKLAEKLRILLKKAEISKLKKELIAEKWQKGNILIFIMALGIVIRQITEFVKSKKEDPGVLVINETGKFVIPLLGGHSAEVNKIAQKLADFTSAEPVITTASDSKALPALDLWIKRMGLISKNPEILPKIMAIFNERRYLKVYKETNFKIPLFNFAKEVDNYREAEVIITNKSLGDLKTQLILIAPNLWVGLGFHEGITEKEIEIAINKVFKEKNLDILALKGIATLEKKAKYLPLKTFCQNKKLILLGFNKDELQKKEACTPSKKVFQAVEVYSVSEQSALVASKGALLIPKRILKNITIAVAEEIYRIPGKLYIVGTGPGKIEYLTLKALTILREAEVVVGYKTYLKFLEKLLPGKEIYNFSMTEEIKRAKKAIEEALKGKIVALISGGDPGIYGMAGLVLEILGKNNLSLEVEIIPGISALNACSALIGAPLMNDFAVISLSDRLTPWEEIKKKLNIISQADLPIVIYNPRSKRRKIQLSEAKKIILQYRKETIPVAVVCSAMRDSQKIYFTTLGELDENLVDMKSTIIIGSSKSFYFNQWFITSRGYERKYEKEFEISSFLE